MGVVVGVLLGGVVQMIGGYGQVRLERKRENRERKHDAYTAFIHALDDVQMMLLLFASSMRSDAVEEARRYFDRYVEASHEINRARTMIRIHGSREAQAIAKNIADNVWRISVDDDDNERERVTRKLAALESDLISIARRDLGIHRWREIRDLEEAHPSKE